MRALRHLLAFTRRHATPLCLAGLALIPVGFATVLYVATIAGAGIMALGFVVTGATARAAEGR